MGYYTGTIFEVAHPSVGYSLGGGGRYDGMIGRFLGTEVPAVGFSLGFERLVELVESTHSADAEGIALLYDADVAPQTLLVLKSALLEHADRVRLVARPKSPKITLEALAVDGFSHFAFVTAAATDSSSLDLRPLTTHD